MSDFYLTLPSHSSKNEFPSNTSNQFKIRLPNPIRLEGKGWKVGLTSLSLPDPTSRLPPLMKGAEVLFKSSWLTIDLTNSSKSNRSANFGPNEIRREDLETLTGVNFTKTMIYYFKKKLVETTLRAGYRFKENDGRKTYVNFKWEGDDLVIDNTGVKVQKYGVEWFPYFLVDTDLAVEIGWFQKFGETRYGLSSNLIIEVLGDVVPIPLDTTIAKFGSTTEQYWKVTPDRKMIKLTMFCNWRFINLNMSFKNVTGTTKRSLFVYSDVGGSGVVGNQVTDLLREVNYKREGKGSQYFEPLHIQYIDVRKEMLDIVEVQVSETTGELVKFGAGNTIATLHFKKT